MNPIAVAIVGIVFGAMALRHLVDTRAKDREARMRLIEKAIDSGQLDREAVQELMGVRRRNGGQPLWKVVLAAGWLGLFGGGAVIALSVAFGEKTFLVIGTVVAMLSFAVVTYPLAVREIEARRGETGTRS